MKSFLKKSLFKKLIISYIAILILPILVMAFSIYRQFDTVLKKELITNNTNTLSRTTYILDSNINVLHNIKDKLSASSVLTSSKNLSDPEKVLALQQELSKYITSNFFINEICVYFHGEDYIYTSRSSHTLPFFINNSYDFSNWEQSNFINDINALTKPSIRKSESVKLPTGITTNLVAFIFPISQNRNVDITLMFFVEQSYIENIIHSNLKENLSEIIIFDKDKNLIVSTFDDYNTNNEKINKFLLSDKSTDIINFDGTKYQAVSDISELSNLTYVMFTPLSRVLEKEQNILLTSLVILLLLLLGGTLLIVFSLRLTYNPIKTLKEFSSSVANINPNTNDEIDDIRGAINYLSAEKNNLLEKTTPMSQDYVLENLIKGRFNSIEELNEQIKTFNISFKTHLYAVLIFHIYDIETSKKQIKAILDNFFFGLIKEEHYTTGRFIAIITPDSTDNDALLQNISDFQQALKDELGAYATIGVSNICDEIQKIPSAYIQACSAIDYRLIKGNGSIIPFSSLASIIEEHEFPYPNNNLESLKYFIRHGEIDNINDILDKTLEVIKKDNLPLFVTRTLCFDMINTIWKAFDEMQKTHLLPSNDYPNITVLSKYDTVDDLIQILKNFCTNICTNVNQTNKKNDDSLINSIIEFINSNYHDGNFTIQIMAEHFNISLTNISQYFKTRTGQTILDYITHLRITEAKQKLLDSDMSVNDIALYVGYLNTTSFIRRFKQITGLTPTQFVKENKK